MSPEDEALREALAKSLRLLLPDPSIAPSTAECLLGVVHRAGWRHSTEQEKRDARAAELLPLGAPIAAERLGVHRATVYTMARRSKTQKHR